MHEQGVHTPTDFPAQALWCLVYQALENERCLDLRYRAISTDLMDDGPVPNYKVMKQLALRNRLGWLYRPFIALATTSMPVLAAVHWLTGLMVVVARVGRLREATLHIIATTPANMRLIKNAIGQEPELRMRHHDQDVLVLRRLSREIGIRGVLFCIAEHIRLLDQILRTKGRKRTDLLLHSRDAFLLLMLVLYAKQRPTHCFATDDHYQRWAFVLSHSCADLRLVQHGFLDPLVGFPNPFGNARTVYVRDQVFAPMYATYYRICQSKVFSPTTVFAPNKFSRSGIFLASSFPSIDDEIDLVRLLKSRLELPVIVKFHPSHAYDARQQTLAALASLVSMDDHPECRLFVSHNSFMEFDYKVAGFPTFSIIRAGGVAATAQSIFGFLHQP